MPKIRWTLDQKKQHKKVAPQKEVISRAMSAVKKRVTRLSASSVSPAVAASIRHHFWPAGLAIW